MPDSSRTYRSANALRREVAHRGLVHGEQHACEVGFGRTPAVVYAESEGGLHGNFLPASYRRILGDPAWARRLDKAYTGAEYLPRRSDRRRGELECTTSSDALLMNVFCYPGVLRRPAVCARLGVDAGLRPGFGVRAELPMRNGEIDRTELDMVLGQTLVEAKLTESGFGYASADRLLRYEGVEQTFDTAALPRGARGFAGYQLVRGVLAAKQRENTYIVLLDGRRADLQELCLRVLSAIPRAEDRDRLRLCTWQELAGALPRPLQDFLAARFGIDA